MKIKNLSFTLFLVVLLNSCKKDSGEDKKLSASDFAGVYTASTTAMVGNTELYTKNNIITNKDAVDKFVEGQKFPDLFLNKSSISILPNLLNLSINVNGESEIDIYVQPFLAPATRVKFTGKIEDITTNDFVLRSIKPDTNYIFSNVPLKFNITKEILPAPYLATIFDHGQGQISVKKQLVVVKDKELYLPMILFSSHEITENSNYRYQNNLYTYYNVMNPSMQNDMGTGDTVAVQQLMIKLIKK